MVLLQKSKQQKMSKVPLSVCALEVELLMSKALMQEIKYECDN